MSHLYSKAEIKGLAVWWVILIVVVIIVVGMIVLSVFLRKPLPDQQIPDVPGVSKEPEKIVNFIGTVEEVSKESLKVVTKAEDSQFSEDRTFIVNVGSETLIQTFKPHSVKLEFDAQGNEIVTTRPLPNYANEPVQTLKLSDFKPGNEVMVVSSENLKEINTFIAQEINFIK